MRKRQIEYSEYVRFLYADPTRREEDDILHLARDITFQITSACNLRCSYCYEHHKCSEDMNIETAKRIIDSIFDTYEADNDPFINRDTKAIVLDFIGGEPLLKAKLIEEICDYWFAEGIRREIPIIPFTRISFATNGMLWFSEESQHLIKKYHEYMSLSVSIDGIKELHDMHRVDKNGNGSFDTAFRAFQDGKQYNWYNSKMTFVPESFQYICDSVKMMIDEGCVDIFCNYAYEPVYTKEQAKALFTELRKLADYLVTEKKDVFVSILDDEIGEQYKDDKNYCGGTGDMLSYAPDGKAYPCVRYAPISVGKEKVIMNLDFLKNASRNITVHFSAMDCETGKDLTQSSLFRIQVGSKWVDASKVDFSKLKTGNVYKFLMIHEGYYDEYFSLLIDWYQDELFITGNMRKK